MKQRNIKNQWKVKLNKVSDIHTSGEVIPLGKWAEQHFVVVFLATNLFPQN
ncbi:hypothetical protein [Chryseobacterium sp.]|uniref:hypothetical protein n=1 Tax=Chryseobacterium sp. TaxID=1871047 RepID=UPI00289A7EA9|nr:hypothetical protein [Chryseobacterium sp.]